MSTSLQEDLEYAYTVLDGKFDENHWHIWGNTNEELDDMFRDINVSDKSVLTVMSSSDYLIMSHLFGAKSVECFDINPLTLRFFYLRKWLIQNGKLEYGADLDCKNTIDIVNSVSSFSSKYEKESNIFWKEIMKGFNWRNWRSNHLITAEGVSSCCVIYREMRDEMKKIVSSDPVFYNVSLSEESGLGIDKKYDYVFISNILDKDNRSPERLEIIKRNLLNILKSDGSVVCTHFPGRHRERILETLTPERKVFDKEFDFHMFEDSGLEEGNITYMYTRKNNL